MDIAFEQQDWMTAPARAGSKLECAHPEWHGLRARLLASHQAWRALGPARAGGAAIASGSFARSAAYQLRVFEADLGSINLNDSANRNPGGHNHMAVAGEKSTGD